MRNAARHHVWLGLIAIAIGLVMGTLSFVWYARFGASDGSGDFSEAYFVLANAFLIVVLLITGLGYSDLRRRAQSGVARSQEKTSQILQHFDTIFYTRTGLSAYFLAHHDEPDELENCVRRCSEFLKFLVDETRTMFEGYLGHPCAVSIKLLVAPTHGKTLAIRTFLRDRKSEFVRGQLYQPEGVYSYIEHSPFAEIISGEIGDFFISNDLRSAAASGKYRNGNPHWRKLYNATLIVPIKEPSVVASENILGFLCIDSPTGKFDQAVCGYMSKIIANVIFYIIYALSILEKRNTTSSNPANMRTADAS